MEYTIEIEESQRSLEFTLDVKLRKDPIFEDAYIEFDAESIELTDDEGASIKLEYGGQFEAINKAYKSKIENMLDEDDNLFEAWKKHMEEI